MIGGRANTQPACDWTHANPTEPKPQNKKTTAVCFSIYIYYHQSHLIKSELVESFRTFTPEHREPRRKQPTKSSPFFFPFNPIESNPLVGNYISSEQFVCYNSAIYEVASVFANRRRQIITNKWKKRTSKKKHTKQTKTKLSWRKK